LQIRQQLVPAAVQAAVTYKGASRMVGITFHETGNTSRGADAAAHANLQSNGNSREASWHWTVDDTEAVQSFPHEARCWHAGSGTAGDGDDTVAIEVCVNADGNLAQAWRNAAELARHIRATDPRVGGLDVQHNHWSGKDCPTRLRAGTAGITWAEVLNLVNDPTTTQGEAFMAGLTDAQQQEMYARIMGFNVQRYDANGNPARALDSLDGQVLRDDIAAGRDRAVAETSAAFHQLVALISGSPVDNLDVDALADALAATLGPDLGQRMVDALAVRLIPTV